MRAALTTLLLLSALLDAGTTRGQTKSPRTVQLTAPPATSGWKVILRILPNPLPAGRCASASVEIQDPHGYRATTLSNGSSIDFHQFRYTSSDTTSFTWQNRQPVFGVLCAAVTATAAQTVVTVTLPEGLTSSVTLTTVAPTARVASVQYAPQAPLRLPTSPEYAPGFVAAKETAPTNGASGGDAGAIGATAATLANTGGATSGLNPIATPLPPVASSAQHRTPPVTVTTGTLTIVATNHTTPPVTVTTGPLTIVGTNHTTPPVTVTTSTLSLTGASTSQPNPVKSPLTTKPFSARQPHAP